MGKEITIELDTIKQLILAIEPNGMTATMLIANGWGTSTIFGAREWLWSWDKQKVLSLNEDEVKQLIKTIIWS